MGDCTCSSNPILHSLPNPQVRTFNATSLYILSICEVCGSYQCPYCPFYSSAPPLPHPFISSAILAALLVIAPAFVR